MAASVSRIAKLERYQQQFERLGLWGILWQHKPPMFVPPGPADAASVCTKESRLVYGIVGDPSSVCVPLHHRGYAVSQVRPEFIGGSFAGLLGMVIGFGSAG